MTHSVVLAARVRDFAPEALDEDRAIPPAGVAVRIGEPGIERLPWSASEVLHRFVHFGDHASHGHVFRARVA